MYLNSISVHRFQIPKWGELILNFDFKKFWTKILWIPNKSILSQYPMILVNFGNYQHNQQILSAAEHSVIFKSQFWQPLSCNIPCIMQSFNFQCCEIMLEKMKNTFPRTAPAMSFSLLKWLYSCKSGLVS